MSDDHKLLEDLLSASVANLLAKVRSGEADAATLNVARQYLKDNGIQARGGKNSPLGNLANELPFTADDGDTLSH